MISREWEFWHKIDYQIETWLTKWSSLSDERKIEGLPWSNFNCEELMKASKDRQSELLKLMSTQSLLLTFLKRPEGFPDYAGQFLHTSGEVVFEALLTNDAKLLKGIFESYLYGCIMKFNALRPKATEFTDWRVQQDFKVAAAVFLDIMDVSGYARLLADYHTNDQLWEIVISAWDKYFQSKETSPLPFFAGVITLTAGAFEIPHRELLRTNWHTRINHKLSDVPRHEEFLRGSFISHSVVDHASALVRIFAQEPYGTFNNGIDVFVVFYLITKDGADQLNFGRKSQNLQDSLDRERSRNESRNGDEEEAL